MILKVTYIWLLFPIKLFFKEDKMSALRHVVQEVYGILWGKLEMLLLVVSGSLSTI